MMVLAVFIALYGGSLHCAAATVGFYSCELMGWKYGAPTLKTISNWVERCGLRALNLTRNLNGEFVAFADASIQIGKEQLLLLLGVRNELVAALDRPLCMADVTVLGMEVQPSWTGPAVTDFVQHNLGERPGVRLAYVVCDQGMNLLAAFRQLCLPVVRDCGHMMMNPVRGMFNDDAGLNTFALWPVSCASAWRLPIMLLATLRCKDRFSRIFTLVEWMERVDGCLDKLPVDLSAQLLEGRNRWLDLLLRQVHQLLVLTARILKHEGLSQATYNRWIEQIIKYVNAQPIVTTQANAFIAGMIDYFNHQPALYAKILKLLCCSDIIESIFGRYRNKSHLCRRAIHLPVQSARQYQVYPHGDAAG